MRLYIGVDYHPYQQTAAYWETGDDEIRYRQFLHSDKAALKRFYGGCGKDSVVGVEATGSLQWFERMLFDNGMELLIGDPRLIRRKALSRHKNDFRDSETILDLLMNDQFPRIEPRSEHSQLMLQMLNYRHSLVGQRTSIANQLQAFARRKGLAKFAIKIYIDEVYFPQREENGNVVEKSGHYISIQPTAPYSDGAITLIVDDKAPRALLISQYRHNTQCYMTEACRGFGDPDDTNERHTSTREREEETFIESKRVKKWETLGYVHTDSGKLMEMPGYFLEFVDAAAELAKRTRERAAMEDPVWVDLKKFYRAIIGQKPITLREKELEFEFILDENSRLEMNTRAEISTGHHLVINDSFTITAGFLALPHILAHYKMTLVELLDL